MFIIYHVLPTHLPNPKFSTKVSKKLATPPHHPKSLRWPWITALPLFHCWFQAPQSISTLGDNTPSISQNFQIRPQSVQSKFLYTVSTTVILLDQLSAPKHDILAQDKLVGVHWILFLCRYAQMWRVKTNAYNGTGEITIGSYFLVFIFVTLF